MALSNAPTIRTSDPTRHSSNRRSESPFLAGARKVALIVLFLLLAVAPAFARIEDCSELSLKRFELVRMGPAGPDRSEIEITADVANGNSGNFLDAAALWTFEYPGLLILEDRMDFGAVAPNATVDTTDSWILELPTAGLSRLASLIRNGNAGIEIICTELPVYSEPTYFFDEATDMVYDSQASLPPKHVFTASTPLLDSLQSGDYLILDPSPGGFDPTQMSRLFFPLEIINITDLGGSIEVETLPLDPVTSIVDGTFRAKVTSYDDIAGTTLPVDIYDLATRSCVDETHLPDTSDPQVCAMGQFPFHFNDVDFGQGLTVSGEIQVRGVPLDLDLRIRGGELQHAVASTRLEWGATLQVKAAADAVVVDAEQRIFVLPLATFTVPVGPFPVAITPVIDLHVGAAGEIAAGSTFSAYQTGMAGLETGWNDGVYSSEPIFDIDPIVFSPPGLASDQLANFRTSLALDLSLLIDGAAGPYLRAEAYGDLAVTPTGDPWFEMGVGVDLSGGFALSLFGFDIAEWEAPIDSLRVDTLSAARPPSPPATSGETVRWGVVLDEGLGTGTFESEDILALSDGSALISGDNTVAGGYLALIDALGQPIWEKKLGQGTVPVRAYELPNLHTIVGGHTAAAFWLAEHDALGNRVWEKSWETDPVCKTEDFVPFDDGAGNTHYMLLGHVFSVQSRNPCLARLDETGELIWAKYYDAPDKDWAEAISLTPDGDFFIAGETDADVGDDFIINVSVNGLLMLVDRDGNTIWSKGLGGRDVRLTSTAIGSSGNLWFAGNVTGGPLHDLPPMFLGSIDPLGLGASHRTFGQAVDWEVQADLEGELNAPPYTPQGDGYTAHDIVIDLEPNLGGLYLAGVSGLGNDSKGWVLNVDEAFGVRWKVEIDGILGDQLHDITDAGDGLLMVGGSDSFLPVGVGGNQGLLIFKQPYEGLIDFDPATLSTTRYNQPMTFPTLTHGFFLPQGEELGDISFTTIDLIGSPGFALTPLTDATSTVTVITPP